MNTFARSFISLCTVAVLLAPSATFASVLLGSASNTTGGSNLLSGLVGYWGLNEGSGSTAYASGGSSSASIALYNSPAWVSGKFGDALSFDGSTQYAESASPSGFNQATSARSMSAWIYITASGTTMVPFVYGSCSPNGAAFGVYLDTSSVLHFWGCGDDFSTGMTLSTGMWYHIVITTLDGSTVTVYVNGVAVDTGTPSVSSLKAPSGTSYLELGGAHDLDPANYYFHGMIDDVRYYNRVLSASEVKQLYQFGAVHIGSVGSIPVSSGLVGYWNMNGNTINWSTGVLRDTSGNGNNGQLMNMSTSTSPVPGKLGQALSFNGTNQYIGGSSSALSSVEQHDMTISAWINVAGSKQQGIVDKEYDGGCGSGYGGWGLWMQSNNKLWWWAESGQDQKDSGSLSVTTGIWTQIALVWHYSTKTVDFYYNGTYSDSNTNSAVVQNPSGCADFEIGALRNNLSGYEFNGSIDDVRIYNRALSPTEIALLYALGTFKIGHADTSLIPNGLVGEWTFDGPTINWATGVVKDVSGNGNDGQLANMSTTTSPVPGKAGQALSFNGSSQYITVSSINFATQSTLHATLSGWVYVTSAASEQGVMGIQLQNGTASGNEFGLILYPNSTNLYFWGNGCDYNSGMSLSSNKWHFIAVTTSDAAHVTVYVDGSSTTGAVGCASLLAPASSNFYIGQMQGQNYPFGGKIDDVRIYNRALSAQEIEQLYESGR